MCRREDKKLLEENLENIFMTYKWAKILKVQEILNVNTEIKLKLMSAYQKIQIR